MHLITARLNISHNNITFLENRKDKLYTSIALSLYKYRFTLYASIALSLVPLYSLCKYCFIFIQVSLYSLCRYDFIFMQVSLYLYAGIALSPSRNE